MENIRHLIATSIFGNDHNGVAVTGAVTGGSGSGYSNSFINSDNEACTSNAITSTPSGIDLRIKTSHVSANGTDNKKTDDTSLDDDINIEEKNDKNIKSNRISIDSTYELLDFNSPDEVIEDEWNTVNRSPILSNEDVPSKVRENNSIEERDTHSPINSPISSPVNSPMNSPTNSSVAVFKNDSLFGHTNNCNEVSSEEDLNKAFRRNQFGNEYGRVSSKEEKQRQNEEIVIMESSSVSSETGSWESVFPQRTPMELKECCKMFLMNERKNTVQTNQSPVQRIPKSPSVEKCSNEKEIPFPYAPRTVAPAVGACFIDASSLYDDTEVVFPESLGPKLPDIACCGPNPNVNKAVHTSIGNISNPEISPDEGYSGLKGEKVTWSQMQPNQFDSLKADKKLSLSGSFDSDVMRKRSQSLGSKNNTPDLTSPNLSDEQKLQHRDIEQRYEYDIKDQYSSDSSTDQKVFSSYGDIGSGEVSRGSTEETEKESKIRQEEERKKGHFLFKNSIQHFSGNVNKSLSDKEDNYVDYSLMSIQSNISDAAGDYNNVFEGGSQYNGSLNDCGNLIPYSRAFSETESVFYPDTPHNSIINVDSPRATSINEEPIASSPEIGIKIPKRVQKCDESAPILSGGVSVQDFTPKQCMSPSVVRRSEACPILSGSIPIDLLEEGKPKHIDKPKNLSLNSWVVDMSDCSSKSSSKRNRSESSSSSAENTTTSKSLDIRADKNGSGNSSKNGLGFYVSLNEVNQEKKIDEGKANSGCTTVLANDSAKKSMGFYVNLSENEDGKSSEAGSDVEKKSEESTKCEPDKKSIFSMFIDFGEKSSSPKGPFNIPPRLSSSLHRDSTLSHSDSDNASMTESKENIVRPEVVRRSMSSSGGSNYHKRHSWNTPNKEKTDLKSGHSRSSSISNDKGIMNIIDTIPHLSKTSSMSIDSPNSPYEDFTCSKSLGSYSNNSNSLTSISVHSSVEHNKVNPDNPDVMTTSARRRQKDAKINETFDKSSQGSLTDGILSKDSSPTTDTDDVTFQNDAEQTGPNAVMSTIVETVEVASPKKTVLLTKGPTKVETHTMETLQATIEKQKLLLETVSEEVQLSSFVKLSDMDKPVQKFELHNNDNLSKSVGSSRIGRLFIDSKSNIPRNFMHGMSRSTGTNLTNLASSVENLRSLSRLFPHLSKELSSSLPTDIQTEDIIKKSPSSEYNQLDILSCTSSLTSSYSRSGIDSADESSLSCRQPRRLGEDLLKMFLQEIATDVTIEVGGRRMRAHKCILRSRCQYFAAILAGGWVQSAGNVISIPGYSYASVHFALCHIYSGASHPPDGISLMELAALADLLGLEGLKEVTSHALRTNYCHNFHKPCSGCIEGILQVFPITLNHGLDDLYRKCLRWSCKHFSKVWPTRAFATLPPDIIGRCKQHVVAHLTSDTVLMTILEFDQLISLLAPCRWAVGVENIVRDIIDIAHGYISDHFANLLASDGFLSLGHGQSWNISRLENILLRIASTLTPEQACRSYQRVTRLNAVLAAKVIKLPSPGLHPHEFGDDEEEMDWNPEFIRLVGSILSAVEQCLTRQCARAMRNSQWLRMDVELRNKIQKLACLSDPVEMRHAKTNKPLTYNMIGNHNRNQNLHQIKMAMRANSKRNQDNNQYKATTHTQTNYTDVEMNDPCVHANNDIRSNNIFRSSSGTHVPDIIPKIRSTEKPSYLGHRRSQSETISSKVTKATGSNCKPIQEKPKTPKLSDIRPRYLDPRGQRGALTNKNQNKIAAKTKNISSSESSTRNSSPAPNKPNSARFKISVESRTMSRDSLASPAKSLKSLKVRNCNDFDLSVDSLGDSLKSSIKTDKTLSQESLIKCNSKLAKETATKPGLRVNQISNNKDILTKNNINKTKSSSCQSTKENSPASLTTKSSRLSSITSTISSPRDGYRGRISTAPPAISTNVGSNQSPIVRKSFLSAKSKEILAKKQSLNQSASTKCVPTAIKEKLSIPVNKSSSTSNMLNRKPNSFNTTLHLRRTAKLNSITGTSQQTSSSTTTTPHTTTTAAKKNADSRKTSTTGTKTQGKKPIKIQVEIEEIEPIRIESKLERSSTFCKESSDIPGGALQVIE